jgi:hypothetical protein
MKASKQYLPRSAISNQRALSNGIRLEKVERLDLKPLNVRAKSGNALGTTRSTFSGFVSLVRLSPSASLVGADS